MMGGVLIRVLYVCERGLRFGGGGLNQGGWVGVAGRGCGGRGGSWSKSLRVVFGVHIN